MVRRGSYLYYTFKFSISVFLIYVISIACKNIQLTNWDRSWGNKELLHTVQLSTILAVRVSLLGHLER